MMERGLKRKKDESSELVVVTKWFHELPGSKRALLLTCPNKIFPDIKARRSGSMSSSSIPLTFSSASSRAKARDFHRVCKTKSKCGELIGFLFVLISVSLRGPFLVPLVFIVDLMDCP